MLRRLNRPPLVLTAGCTGLALVLTACGGGSGGGGMASLNGAGASFPAAAYQRWSIDYAQSRGARINYQAVGSGAGVRQFLAGTVDFGASDEQLAAAEFQAAGARGVVQIPMLGGTITPAYNNPTCPNLKLTQAQLADVFLGRIRNWKQLGCPTAAPITVVHRSDGSGTTYGFTNALSCFSPRWQQQVGRGKAVNWPVGVGAKGNEGVAAAIANTPASIGYVNQAYLQGAVKGVALQNRAGNFVAASAASGAAGLHAVRLNEQLGGETCNPTGAQSFPIVSFTWILTHARGHGPAKAAALRQFLDWALAATPQQQASQLGYVPLSGDVLKRARAAVATIAP